MRYNAHIPRYYPHIQASRDFKSRAIFIFGKRSCFTFIKFVCPYKGCESRVLVQEKGLSRLTAVIGKGDRFSLPILFIIIRSLFPSTSLKCSIGLSDACLSCHRNMIFSSKWRVLTSRNRIHLKTIKK